MNIIQELFFYKKFDIMIRFRWSFLPKNKNYLSVNGRILLKKILFDQICISKSQFFVYFLTKKLKKVAVFF